MNCFELLFDLFGFIKVIFNDNLSKFGKFFAGIDLEKSENEVTLQITEDIKVIH